jgi:hypothetical protein
MTDVPSPIPAPIQTLVTLFEETLTAVNFPDVNTTVLQEASKAVVDAHTQVTRLEAELTAARAALSERQDALLGKAQRALAYARIFAEEQPELLSRLDAVSLPRAGRRQPKVEATVEPVTAAGEHAASSEAPRKRGRPARARPAGMLFQDEATDAPASA